VSELDTLVRRLVAEEVARQLAELRPAQAPPVLLTCREAAALARVNPGSVRRWIRTGRLPATGSGRLLRIQVADLERLLASGRRRDPGSSAEDRAERDFG
jgi:excisionase family DNA binding protein